ncbi:MAG: hydroxyacid dehydrogenase [Rhodospirillaceae bacterium]|nr:hydroxyacid dehydrogenase [Rhodospirillaceae bacterium]MBT7293494.1 hydroxyacid dehydrogenase [Rhodospirillaceae bacterium]
MPKVIIHDAIDPAALELLNSRPGMQIVTLEREERARLRTEISDADSIILRYLPLDADDIRAARNMKVISRHGVGYDNVDMAAANECGIPVATIGDANSLTVAELALYLMLAAAKQGLGYDKSVRAGDWWQAREAARTIELYGKTLLVVGFGRIGKLVAPRCHAFGMNVTVCDPYIAQNLITDAGFTPAADFNEALGQADIITLHTPLNDETRHMIDARALERMKAGALLVNTSRGPVVDGQALSDALSAGHIYAAGIDVFEEEPPPTSNPLFAHDNTILTPHIGGLTRECFHRSAIRCAQNTLDAIDGKLDKAFVVNPEVL